MAAVKIKSLIKARGVNKANISRLIKHIQEHALISSDALETRKQKLEEYYQAFTNIQFEIEELAEEAKLEADQDLEREQFDEIYFECSDLISQRIRELDPIGSTSATTSTQATANANANNSKVIVQQNTLLPKIEIRPFDGNPIEWHSFHDTFQSLVHNDTQIPAVQKFYLLKNSLRGSVATIIDPLNASEENYFVAWEMLKQRCDKPRQIIQTHIKMLLELTEINKDSPISLRTLKEKALMHVNALKALQVPVDSWDAILVYIIIQKLDKATRRTWERTLENNQMPKFTELIAFLNKQERGDDIEECINIKPKYSNSIGSNRIINRIGKPLGARGQAYVSAQPRYECAFCQGDHGIYACQEFMQLSPHERSNAARNKRLCINCLRNNHNTSKCLAPGCKKCSRRHNTLLHFEVHNTQRNNVEQQSPSNQQSTSSVSTESVKKSYAITYDSEVLLGTARVYILDQYNRAHECRVLLDGCSQCNFISEKLADNLKLIKQKINLPFAGLGQLTTRAEYKVKTTIKSRINNFESQVEFVALPTITGILPSRQVNKGALTIPHNIQLADPEFNKPAEIDALIGTTLFYKLLSNGQIKLSNNTDAVLQKTLLGWIVAGEVGKSENFAAPKSCHVITSLDKQLMKFWEVEEIPNKKHLSTEELACEKLYNDSTIRGSDGRYIVRLPFNERKDTLGNSYNMALRRFYSLERKLAKDKVLKNEYSKFLREYHELGHMKEITNCNVNGEGYYIPHHAVIREANLSTKVRVVFDASAKSTTNVSLNDTLRVGPTVQRELVLTIMKFRLHNVVLTADLQKMYRQVNVNNYDAVYQKILWRDNEHDALRVYKLTTVTQGTASAPFLATRTLQRLAEDEGKNFPLAYSSLKNDCYVDDLLTGTDSIEKALELKDQLISLLKCGGFEFHKWASNKHELVIESKNKDQKQNICLNNETKKLLGVHWDSIEDIIVYSIKPFNNNERLTKRSILSQIAQLFDPLGLIGPIIIVAKIMMQELWKANLNWDESVPQLLHTKWTTFKNELPILNKFKVKRQITLADAIEYQLHGFCDASEQAYGACVYLRCVNKVKKCSVQLICAKSRVAPLKTITVPRLELCAAQLLTKLVKTVSEALQISFHKIKLWSDSTITLHWIKSAPYTLKTFVANRVVDIQAGSNIDDWYHIATDENPADYISRGQTPYEFLHNDHWLYGPSWLSQDESQWKIKELIPIEIPEQRLTTALMAIKNSGHVGQDKAIVKKTQNAQVETNDTFERFSSIDKLNRFVAFCQRTIKNRKIDNKVKGGFSVEEIQNAHRQILRIEQQNHFSRDIERLKQGKEVHSKSEIRCLNPCLDTDGIIRVGGRLTHAAINYSRKYPILLPRNSHITKLIILNQHIKNWHAGVQGTLNAVRNNYWPIDGKNSTRHIVRKCVRCYKVNPKLPTYVMGDLPKNRITQSRPFECVGIDYCGPFFLKEKKFRNKGKLKCYVSVFVCFATRAVHMELVTDLTTETCLEAIRRFCARRGKPSHIYSDNATNFVGVKNEILKIRAFFLSEENQSILKNSLLNEEINWHFIPPRSPHFGGLWEAAVKSFKQHLYRTVGDTMFTYEQFNTFVIEIESILNSRPLTPLSCDPNDLTALTPAHFLIGRVLTNIPETDLRNVTTNRLSMWQHIHKIKQHFWQRWHKEYLNELRTRSKWHQGNGAEITVGKLVTIKEDNFPPMHWSIGRIIAVHPGQDSVIRVATVKTPCGVYKRCVNKLAPLPIDTPTDNALVTYKVL
ncbi:uncharacterized protein LOC105664283 [Megachile rotundata]|uniref:uncharacterized protein LOC105664283 n=1 Tax=Megachile rotundata TaxID=143995 RepID=UPI003FD27206